MDLSRSVNVKMLSILQFLKIFQISSILQRGVMDVMSDIVKAFKMAQMEKEDEAVFKGISGVTSVESIFGNANSTIVVMPTGDTAFSDLSYDNIVDLSEALTTYNERGAKFFGSKYVMGLIRKLKDSNGLPIFKDGHVDLVNNAGIYGEFIKLDNTIAPSSGDSGVSKTFLGFGNLKNYKFRQYRQPIFASIQDTTNFRKGQTTLGMQVRVGGGNSTPSAIALLKTPAS